MIRAFKDASDFKTWIEVGVLWLLIAVLLRDDLASLWDAWVERPDTSHGMLVPAITCFLLWKKLREPDGYPLEPSVRGLVFFLSAALIYLIGSAGFVFSLKMAGFVGMFIGIPWCCAGKAFMKRVWFPFFFLFLMIPIPASIVDAVSFPLRVVFTRLATSILHWLSIPVLQEGNLLVFPRLTLEVAQECSGIRSLQAYAVLAVLFAYLLGPGAGVLARAGMLVLAVPLAVAVNVARIVGTGIVAYYLDMDITRGVLHSSAGLTVFLVGFAVYCLVFSALKK